MTAVFLSTLCGKEAGTSLSDCMFPGLACTHCHQEMSLVRSLTAKYYGDAQAL